MQAGRAPHRVLGALKVYDENFDDAAFKTISKSDKRNKIDWISIPVKLYWGRPYATGSKSTTTLEIWNKNARARWLNGL